MSTFLAKTGEMAQKWHLIDASNQVVGRLAVKIANILRGKHRPEYTPHTDIGDHVIVINAEKLRFTGRKLDQKSYDHYTYHPGGLKTVSARELMARRPERVLELAILRMMPRNRLARRQFHKLNIYRGPSHPHQAQQPVVFKLEA